MDINKLFHKDPEYYGDVTQEEAEDGCEIITQKILEKYKDVIDVDGCVDEDIFEEIRQYIDRNWCAWVEENRNEMVE